MARLKVITWGVCLVGLILLNACTSKKEVPQPVVDTQRLDQLREELRNLQGTVLGNTATYSQDSLTYTQLLAQIAGLQAQLSKKVSYSVIVSDYQGNYLPGAVVKVSQAGAVVSQTTSSLGVATFNNLNGGIVSATVDLTGFARLVFRADIRNYNTDQTYSAASNVLMLPMGGTPASDLGMYTVDIKLFANYSTQDDTLGGPDYWEESTLSFALPVGPNPNNRTVSYTPVTDKPITAYLSSDFLNNSSPPDGFTYNLLSYSGEFGSVYDPGSVVTVAYENATYTVAAAGSNGVYALKLPATSFTGNATFGFDLEFTEFSNTFTEYVPGGNITIHPPFAPTITTAEVFRVAAGCSIRSHVAKGVSSRKYFYFNSLN